MKPQLPTELPREKQSRILFISHDASRTGAPMVLLHLLRWMKKNTSHEFDILICRGGELETEFAQLGPVFHYPRPQKRKSLFGRVVGKMGRLLERMGRGRKEENWLAETFSRRNIGLIYSNTVTNGVVLNLLAPLKCPVICHVHELEPTIRFYHYVESLETARRVGSRFVAVSKGVWENLAANHGIGEKDLELVYGFVPVQPLSGDGREGQAFREKYGISRDAILVGSCGTIYWRKGSDLFVQLALRMHQICPEQEICFLWAGGGAPPEALQQVRYDVRLAGLEGRVQFIGPIADSGPFFQALDIFALLSREDPFPLVMLEAAAACKPIVCFAQTGGGPEFVDAACIAPYMDIEAMTGLILQLIQNPQRRLQTGLEMREKVVRNHDVPTGAKAITAIIDRMMAP